MQVQGTAISPAARNLIIDSETGFVKVQTESKSVHIKCTVLYRPVFGVAKGEADIGGLLRGKISDMERGRRSPAVRGVVIGTILCMGPVVVERNACDLPAICSGAFHDSILLCLVGVTKGVMAGAF